MSETTWLSKKTTHVHEDRGQTVDRPTDIPFKGWKDIAKRVLAQLKADHVSLVSAGVAFYGFLALFPAMIAGVSLYALFSDPTQIEHNMNILLGVLPPEAYDMFKERLHELSHDSNDALGLGAILGIALALWSANKGTKALFEGINITYDETNSRSFLHENALTLLFTVAGAIVGAIAVVLITGFDAIIDTFHLEVWVIFIFSLVRWLALALLITGVLALLYRYAPVRSQAKLRWLTVGSIAATTLWLAGSWAFAYYTGNFGNYDQTYGSLAGVAIFLLWMYLTAYIILLGAEINSEAEHQTVRDTTVGPRDPLGQRGAFHADHVANVPE